MGKTKPLKKSFEELQEVYRPSVPEYEMEPTIEDVEDALESSKDPYHNTPDSILGKPGKLVEEVNFLKSNLDEILNLVDKLTGRLQPILSKKETQGSTPRESDRFPEMVGNIIEMNNVAVEAKEKLADLDVNIVI